MLDHGKKPAATDHCSGLFLFSVVVLFAGALNQQTNGGQAGGNGGQLFKAAGRTVA